jgi:hypothetical protein
MNNLVDRRGSKNSILHAYINLTGFNGFGFVYNDFNYFCIPVFNFISLKKIYAGWGSQERK